MINVSNLHRETTIPRTLEVTLETPQNVCGEEEKHVWDTHMAVGSSSWLSATLPDSILPNKRVWLWGLGKRTRTIGAVLCDLCVCIYVIKHITCQSNCLFGHTIPLGHGTGMGMPDNAGGVSCCSSAFGSPGCKRNNCKSHFCVDRRVNHSPP